VTADPVSGTATATRLVLVTAVDVSAVASSVDAVVSAAGELSVGVNCAVGEEDGSMLEQPARADVTANEMNAERLRNWFIAIGSLSK